MPDNEEPLPGPWDTLFRAGVSPRRFGAAIGGILLLIGVFALFAQVSGDYDAGMFGTQSVDCGNAIAADTADYGGDALDACQDALATRRAWGWPLTGVGAIVLVGAVVVRNPQPRA